MGLIAVHHPSGVDTGPVPNPGALRAAADRLQAGLTGGEWIVLWTKDPALAGGYVGPYNDPRWRREHGVAYPDERRAAALAAMPVGVDRI